MRRLLLLLVPLLRGVRYRVVPRLAYALGHLRSHRQVVSQWPEGEIPLGPRVALFVHWDGAGAVREHVLHYVSALGNAGFSVVFVSNAGRLLPAAAEALKTVCAGIIVRRNVGYDFGAWREGIERLRLPRPDTEMFVMANDSVYGPLRPLGDMLAQVDFSKAEVWAPTESWQSRYHLQSYFLAAHPSVLASQGWRRFWDSVRPTPSKHWVIHRYEVGLTQALLRAGFRCRAIWPYWRLAADVPESLLVQGEPEGVHVVDPVVNMRRVHARRVRDSAVLRVPLNPTSDLWRQLLRNGFPFIKRELLRDNPTHVMDIGDWRDVVEGELHADATLIERDLQRTLRHRAP